ncbi:MAG TPA: SAM-dependent methyltransferase, partial [Candidatus Omnitrophica bacterium]|nr:SAM-dependent methyltransferase [Candidatus Omnitrophota bacterium]
ARRLRSILDRSPHKHGRFTPGTHLPVVDVSAWEREGATHMVILAWNFKDEIMAQMRLFAQRGGRFVIPIPQPEVV